jgi:hypothetical protein
MPKRETNNPLRDLRADERLKVVLAVRKGAAVHDPRLAAHAVAYARWIQAPERHAGAARLFAWVEVGRIGTLVFAGAVLLLVRADALTAVFGALGLLVVMFVLSRRERRVRNARAAAAETKNSRLVDARP